ncbi:hypothetical protein JRG66_02280 [Salinimicrobium tongyeongense]|uniref:Fibronectin type-III domain-containing protein n=1 Tax=Salinimicrobium tongyeongense TaxID=2809707 RepID=A0ABY6NS55_9FLAO|nr:hypothetical protein [Salinimicrobium tongyeongense]UZH55735.1 hypothetical protein JRG66_02280 [Salinimicrobium tongyeongense]
MKNSLHKFVFMFMSFSFFMACDSDDGTREPQLPEVVTLSGESEAVITHTSVQISGTLMGDASDIQSYGVVWSTNPNPTLDDNVALPEGQTTPVSMKKSNNRQSEDPFVVKIEDLNPGINYYFRTFATNEAGTAYGEQLSLETHNLAGSKWELTYHHEEDVSWVAHVEFYEDGTAFYTEPAVPGVYDLWGEWSMEDNLLTYDMIPDNEGENYILTGELQENEMSGTYTFNTTEGMTNRPWTGFLLEE